MSESEIIAFRWPEHPICHGENPRFGNGAITWREPRLRTGHDDPYSQTYRTCSYCGSIHPQDLLRVIAEGAKIGGSDWKYGWPHKFYIMDIPNPAKGQPVKQYGYGGSLESWRESYPNAAVVEGEDRKFYLYDYPAPGTMQAKWYNKHLHDLDAQAFAVISGLLRKHTHIEFRIEEGKIRYSAPYVGYQA